MSGTYIIDPEATKVIGQCARLPLRYSQYPATQEVLQCPDFSVSAEQLCALSTEIEQRIESGEHPALAVFGALEETSGNP